MGQGVGPVLSLLCTEQWTEWGKVSKVRGVSFTRRVAPVNANRIVDAVKKRLNKHITDVYFIVDNFKGPAPGVLLVIRTTLF